MKHGWRIQKLGDLFEFKYGKGLIAEHRHVDGSVKVYGSNGIIGRHSHSLSKGPTVLVGRKGSVGEVHFSSSACWPIDTTYYVDEFPDGFPLKYWAFYLKSLRLGTHDKSSAIPGVSRKDIYGIEVPVPSPAEQHRIVAKLEKLLAKVEECQERLNKIPALLKRFRQSVLAAACSGRLTSDLRRQNEGSVDSYYSQEALFNFPPLPETWRWEPLAAVCEKIVDCPHSTPKWTNSNLGRLCVRTTNFKPGFLDLAEVRYVSNETFMKRFERLKPHPGDILYSREGGILGIACMIPKGVELCLGQRMMLFRPNHNFTGALLMHWLNSPVILHRVQELIGGSAAPHLNVKDIKNFPTPVPPLVEQQEIVRRVEALFKIADQIEERYRKAKAYIDKLIQSILAKAFRGELVPQDANDEPASVLRERIHASKNADPSNRQSLHPRKARIKR